MSKLFPKFCYKVTGKQHPTRRCTLTRLYCKKKQYIGSLSLVGLLRHSHLSILFTDQNGTQGTLLTHLTFFSLVVRMRYNMTSMTDWLTSIDSLLFHPGKIPNYPAKVVPPQTVSLQRGEAAAGGSHWTDRHAGQQLVQESQAAAERPSRSRQQVGREARARRQ